jgi:hypothetical protein
MNLKEKTLHRKWGGSDTTKNPKKAIRGGLNKQLRTGLKVNKGFYLWFGKPNFFIKKFIVNGFGYIGMRK